MIFKFFQNDFLKRAEMMLQQADKLGCRAFISPQVYMQMNRQIDKQIDRQITDRQEDDDITGG